MQTDGFSTPEIPLFLTVYSTSTHSTALPNNKDLGCDSVGCFSLKERWSQISPWVQLCGMDGPSGESLSSIGEVTEHPMDKYVENEITLLSPKPEFPEACRNCGPPFKYTHLFLQTQFCSYHWWAKDWEPSCLGKEVLVRMERGACKQLSGFREWNGSKRCSNKMVESPVKRWGQFL